LYQFIVTLLPVHVMPADGVPNGKRSPSAFRGDETNTARTQQSSCRYRRGRSVEINGRPVRSAPTLYDATQYTSNIGNYCASSVGIPSLSLRGGETAAAATAALVAVVVYVSSSRWWKGTSLHPNSHKVQFPVVLILLTDVTYDTSTLSTIKKKIITFVSRWLWKSTAIVVTTTRSTCFGLHNIKKNTYVHGFVMYELRSKISFIFQLNIVNTYNTVDVAERGDSRPSTDD